MRCDKITSSANAKIKHVVHLRDRKQRKEDGLTIVEGMREIARALEAGIPFKELYLCRSLVGSSKEAGSLIDRLARKDICVFEVNKSIFAKISYGDRSEGMLAICAPVPLALKELRVKERPLYVVVECVEKPGNLGAILRTCDGAGVDSVIICDGRTDIYNPNVIRSSLGTVFSVKTVISTNAKALEFLRSRNIRICATLPQAKIVYTQARLNDAAAIIVGSEQDGLTDFWIKHADEKVRIPMRGQTDSLNVSVSAAILIYEAIRQRSN